MVLPLTENVLVSSGAALVSLTKKVLLTSTLTGSVTEPSTVKDTVDPSVPYMNRCTSRSKTYTVPASVRLDSVVYGAPINTCRPSVLVLTL